MLCCIAVSFILTSCKTQRETTSTPEEERESLWNEWERKSFLESCIRDAHEVEGLHPEHYCNCFLEKLQYDYTIDEVMGLSEELIFEIAEECVDSQPEE